MVSRETIQQAISNGEDMGSLSRKLGCGTSCASCLPEIRSMFNQGQQSAWRHFRVPASLAIVLVLLALLPPLERGRARGPANTGHSDLSCEACHWDAPGTMRQQIQANTRKLLGTRESWAPFVHQPVRNGVCKECHDRQGEDRHPSFRFRESRFEEARAAIAPQYCTSCHLEHQGGRLTRSGDYCTHCHQEFELEQDVLNPSHQQLADEERFDTCLQCHDFHGNHLYTVPETLEASFDLDTVRAYLDGGDSPYGTDKRFPDRSGKEDGG